MLHAPTRHSWRSPSPLPTKNEPVQRRLKPALHGPLDAFVASRSDCGRYADFFSRSTACAAASRAIGTRNGEQLT